MNSTQYSAIKTSGDGRGRTIGFPTINLIDVNPSILSEISGVFVVHTIIDSHTYLGVIHIGPRPTFNAKEKRVEIHLLNFSQSLKDNTIIEFKLGKKIREIQKFKNTTDLITQIKKDIKTIENKNRECFQKNI